MSGNFLKPALGDSYALFASAVRDLCEDLAKGLDGTGTTNSPLGSIRWDNSLSKWRKQTSDAGAALVYADLATTYDINVTSANSVAAWTTGRTITLTGDTSGTSAAWTGSTNLSFATTLATVNSNVGVFGNSTSVPVVTVNGKGLVTAISTVTLGGMSGQPTDNVAITGGTISGVTLTLKQSAAPTPTANGDIWWDNDSFVLRIGNGAAGTKTISSDDIAATLANKTLASTCTWNGGTIGIGYGGTGATTFTSGGILRGNGSSALSIASAADIVAAISTTAVTNATVGATVTLTADNTTNATNYPLFTNAATGNLSPRTDTGYTYNPSTGVLTAISFTGALTGNASTATSSSTCSGNATTATTLATPRTIDGVSFNGGANIEVIAPAIHAASSKVTPVDADKLGLSDSAASWGLKYLTWANLKSVLKAYFDPFYLGGSPIQPISASVSGNALTISASSLSLDFRSTALTSGAITSVTGTPANLVISSGSKLGTTDNIKSRIVVLALNDAGTIRLAAVNILGGNDLSEGGLISTTAEGGVGGADSSNTVYSSATHTNLAYRVVGYIESTQATAGTWVTTPSTIQGMGGNALTNMSSLGYGQTWQDVSGSRSSGTTYYNTTGRPIVLALTLTGNGTLSVVVNSITVFNQPSGGAFSGCTSVLIPAGASYSFTAGASISSCTELR